MRVLSLVLGAVASASVVMASACKPSPVTSSSSSSSAVASSSSSPVVLSSSSASSSASSASSSTTSSASSSVSLSSSSSASSSASSSSSAAAPIATFAISAGNTAVTTVSGKQLEVYDNDNFVYFDAAIDDWKVATFQLEAETNYLVAGSYYIAYNLPTGSLLSATSSTVSSDNLIYIICTAPTAYGATITCYPNGLETYAPYVQKTDVSNFQVYMFNPSSVSAASGYSSFDFVVGEVS
ncbi:hypothetical protein SEUCBS139899_010278 [Sporothrix eucalyptigena]|uniref:Uncharacterized protein n=1 Tax=Sporothrix eucalyptigena TaxID=1812306 RepID=A0ABP0CRB7_9PEZI